MVLIQDPPKMVYDASGSLIEVVLSAGDFRTYLRALAAESDWAALPSFLQDAIDAMLIDEVQDEREDAVDLDAILASEAASE